jgi:hypothetical protein
MTEYEKFARDMSDANYPIVYIGSTPAIAMTKRGPWPSDIIAATDIRVMSENGYIIPRYPDRYYGSARPLEKVATNDISVTS